MPLPSGGMTDRAIVGVDFLARRKVDPGARRQVGERAHMVRDRHDLVALEHAVLAERRHLALVRLRVGPERTPNSIVRWDLVEHAAPQPVIVVQVRIALGAAAARAVARSAVLAEGGRGPVRR